MGLESAFCDFFAGEYFQAKINLKMKNKLIFLISLKTCKFFYFFKLSNGVSVFRKCLFLTEIKFNFLGCLNWKFRQKTANFVAKKSQDVHILF